MKISFKLTIAFFVALLSLVVTGWLDKDNLARVSQTRNWVEHTNLVLAKIESVKHSLTRLESAARGFSVNGDLDYLEDYSAVKTRNLQELEQVKSLTGDNPKQQALCQELAEMTNAKLSFLERLIDGRKNSFEQAKVLMSEKTGLKLMSSFERVISDIKNEELQLLNKRSKEAQDIVDLTEKTTIYGTLVSMLIVGVIGYIVSQGIGSKIAELQAAARQIGDGIFSARIGLRGKDELTVLGNSFNEMAERLQALHEEQNVETWVKDSFNKLVTCVQGLTSLEDLAGNLLKELVPLIGAQQATLYGVSSIGEHFGLRLLGSYACEKPEQTIEFGEGLVGQTAIGRARILLEKIPSESIVVKSSLIHCDKLSIVVEPIQFSNELKAVLEVASISGFKAKHLALLSSFAPWVGSVINSIELNIVTVDLLKETQEMNEELQAQQEEMEAQQEELRQTNEELEQKSDELEEQNQLMLEQNQSLDKLHESLREKAEDLALASKYKSEFLANMSHDLRTPLNSMLIFADILADNSDNNLTEEQTEFARSIKSSGISLLELINEVLDLSKIESGKISFEPEEVSLALIMSRLRTTFGQTAERKGLRFETEIDTSASAVESIYTDEKRLLQILNNLVSNAFKFTNEGGVTIRADRCADKTWKFSVKDTGIGIAAENQQKIFEPFQQAELGIQKEFGGTGLGLSICRELAFLLGGKIELSSSPNNGSEFILLLPMYRTVVLEDSKNSRRSFNNEESMPLSLPDDRSNLSADDRTLLIIEDDRAFAHILLNTARKSGFKGIVAATGKEGLLLAEQLNPDGITLDLHLPGEDGWLILDQLKRTVKTRHIPVHIISVENERIRGLAGGAFGYLEKPTSTPELSEAMRKIRDLDRNAGSVLLVAGNEEKSKRCMEIIEEELHEVHVARSAQDAFSAMEAHKFQCVVLASSPPDMSMIEFIEHAQKQVQLREIPILLHHETEFNAVEQYKLRLLHKTGIVKQVATQERLLLETTLFLHRVESSLPAHKRSLLKQALAIDATLSGRKILIADDDPRNQAALRSLLGRYKMEMVFADNGKDCLLALQKNQDIELILMDIMMPEMDGLEAIAQIRKDARFEALPIIAVTAKAMKDDRKRCLEAGASDYISKPIDTSQLCSLLRVWLAKRSGS